MLRYLEEDEVKCVSGGFGGNSFEGDDWQRYLPELEGPWWTPVNLYDKNGESGSSESDAQTFAPELWAEIVVIAAAITNTSSIYTYSMSNALSNFLQDNLRIQFASIGWSFYGVAGGADILRDPNGMGIFVGVARPGLIYDLGGPEAEGLKEIRESGWVTNPTSILYHSGDASGDYDLIFYDPVRNQYYSDGMVWNQEGNRYEYPPPLTDQTVVPVD